MSVVFYIVLIIFNQSLTPLLKGPQHALASVLPEGEIENSSTDRYK